MKKSSNKRESLLDLPRAKIDAVLRKLDEARVTQERFVQLLHPRPGELDLLGETWPSVWKSRPGIVYDAAETARILGLRSRSYTPPPTAAENEIIVYYGGWSLRTLRLPKKGKEHMRYCFGHDYDHYYWARGNKKDRGYYRLLLPVPGSDRMLLDDQWCALHHLQPGRWNTAPTCIVATALIVHFLKTGEDLLLGHPCRTEDKGENGQHIVAVFEELVEDHEKIALHLDMEGEFDCRGPWIAACQKC